MDLNAHIELANRLNNYFSPAIVYFCTVFCILLDKNLVSKIFTIGNHKRMRQGGRGGGATALPIATEMEVFGQFPLKNSGNL